MSCPEAEQIVPLYAAGELRAQEARRVEGHLRECRSCSELVRDVRGIHELCRETLGTLRVNPPTRVSEAARPRPARKGSGALVAAVALATIGLAVYMAFRSPGRPLREETAGPPETVPTGRVLARVSFRGGPSGPEKTTLTERNACCKAHVGRVPPGDGTLEEALIYVKSGLGRREFASPAEPAILRKQGCIFGPRVSALRVDQKVVLRNYDEGAHALELSCRKNKECTFRLTGRGEGEEFRDEQEGFFPVPEIGMRIECPEHPWISLTVHVLDHPFFAVTGPDGSATLEGLPTGEYEVAAWHPRYGERTAAVKVVARQAEEIRFVFENP